MNKKIENIARQSGFDWALNKKTLFEQNTDADNLNAFAKGIIKECAIAVANANNPLGRSIDKLFEMHFEKKL